MDPKSPFDSKTIWLNTIATVAFVAAGWLIDHQGLLPLVGVSPAVAGALVALANIYLRFRTKQPISLRG